MTIAFQIEEKKFAASHRRGSDVSSAGGGTMTILSSPLAMTINNDAVSDAGTALQSLKLTATLDSSAPGPVSPAKDDLSGLTQMPKAGPSIPGVIQSTLCSFQLVFKRF